MPPHLLLSMSLPNNGPDFGRSGFRPVRLVSSDLQPEAV